VSDAGVSLWRRVSDTILQDMRGGGAQAGSKLPAEATLASRLGVARPTVRRALLHLQGLGLIQSVHGRGTFVTGKMFEYRIAAQKTFEENLVDSARIPSRRLLDSERLAANDQIAQNLAIAPGATALRLALLNYADTTPVSLAVVFLPVQRLPGLEAAVEKARSTPAERLSMAGILQDAGVTHFQRQYIRLSARPPSPEERAHLEIDPAEYVMQTESVSADTEGLPVFYSMMAYSSARSTFYVGPEAFAARNGHST
jgi:phosphonate metabolism transcriptional regulator PhnF